MSNWLPELESALKNVKKPTRKVRVNPVISKPPLRMGSKKKQTQLNGNLNLWLFFTFLTLSVVFAGLYRWKQSRVVLPPKVQQRERPGFLSPTPDLSKYDKKIDALTSQTEKLSADVSANRDKITLTGILLNNNFVANWNGLKDSYIYLNHDWTINRIPDQLTLDEQDIEFLNKKLRKTKEKGQRWNKKE